MTKNKNITITVDGKEYPCRPTMGAMLRFKQQTGKDVSEMSGEVCDMATYLWCCIASACKRDGIQFDLPLMDFADSITEEDMLAWAESMAADMEAIEEEQFEEGGSKKK